MVVGVFFYTILLADGFVPLSNRKRARHPNFLRITTNYQIFEKHEYSLIRCYCLKVTRDVSLSSNLPPQSNSYLDPE